MKSSKIPLLLLILVLEAGCSGGGGSGAPSPVIAPALVSIDVEPAISSILTGSIEQFTATGIYSNNSATNLTSSVIWTSSPDVATIDSNGLVAAVSTATTSTTMVMARSGIVTGSAILTVTGGNAAPAGNVLPITVNGSLCSASTSAFYLNKPCVSVTVCAPGTSTCQTINDILLDTGSSGLRIFKQALTVSLTQISSGSGSVAECAQFGSFSEWGSVQSADVTLGSETAKNVPIQVIDSTFGTVPNACGIPDATPSAAGFTGILGVGVLVQDCGSVCESQANNGIYYSCSGSTSGSPCAGTKVSLASQVQNPVALLPNPDNNGVIVELPTVPSNGSQSVNGILVLGIGTKTNNTPSGVTAYNTDGFGEIITSLGGTFSGIIDSGSNGLFFTPPSKGLLPDCPSPDAGWFCPSSITTLSAKNEGASGSPSNDVFFQIGNFMSLTNSPNNVFSNIGGPALGLFDWGLPFHFGKNIYVAIDGKNTSIGPGPYFAY